MVSNRYYGQKTIGLFINPTAGKGRALRVAKLVEQRLRAEGIDFVSYQHWPVALPEVHEAWIIGGDGTLNYFINAYPHTQIPLVIFKGGTGNDFAWKLYGDCTGAQQLDKVLAATVRPVDAGVCNGKLYLNSTGIGFDGEVLHSMRRVRLLGGHWGYLMVVVKKIFTFKEHRFAIRAEGLALDDRFLLVAINNSSRTGGGFLVSPQASVADGLLDLVLCKKLGIIKRLRALPLIEKGKHLGRPYVVYQQHTAVTVTCDKELYAQLDGELIKAKEFAISVLRNRFLFRY